MKRSCGRLCLACFPQSLWLGVLAWLRPGARIRFQASARTRVGKPRINRPEAKDATTKTKEPDHVYKTNEEWQKLLTHEQFLVTRMKATEPAFSGKYSHGHFKGTFLCVCCGARLFDARTKFESGTGWPSFWKPVIHRPRSRPPGIQRARGSPGRGLVPPLRRAPRPRLPGRTAAHRPAILHQFGRHPARFREINPDCNPIDHEEGPAYPADEVNAEGGAARKSVAAEQTPKS